MIDLDGRLRKIEEYTQSITTCYPSLTNGTTVTGAVGAWTLGEFQEITPVNTITADFSIYAIIIESASKDDVYEIVLYDGTTEISRVRAPIVRIGVTTILLILPVQTPRILKNSQIQARFANALGGSETITISFNYRIYV